MGIDKVKENFSKIFGHQKICCHSSKNGNKMATKGTVNGYSDPLSLDRFEPRHEKTNILVSALVRHKPGCIATEDV